MAKAHKRLFLALSRRHCFDWMPDAMYLRLIFRVQMGRKLNLKDPQTFNEKLQWLKLHDRKHQYTEMVDKAAAKEYAAQRIGRQYIIPTLGVWEHFDDIDFDALPDQFVLKCTHDSGGLVICKDKQALDKAAAKKKLESSLSANYYLYGREWPYKNVPPRILAEPYMEDEAHPEDLADYKLMCFGGKMKCSFVCTNRRSKTGLNVTFFDRDWNRLPFQRHYPADPSPLPKPAAYDEMIRLAELLSQDLPFARIDFYDINGNIYFGEITFYPGSGMEEFTPEQADYDLGNWIDLTGLK